MVVSTKERLPILNGRPVVSIVSVPSTLTLAPGPALIPPIVVVVAGG